MSLDQFYFHTRRRDATEASAKPTAPVRRRAATRTQQRPRLDRRDIVDLAPAPYALLIAIAVSLVLFGLVVQGSNWAI